MAKRLFAAVLLASLCGYSAFGQAGTPTIFKSWSELNEASDVNSGDLGCYNPSQIAVGFHNLQITLLRNPGSFTCGFSHALGPTLVGTGTTTQDYLGGSLIWTSLNYRPTAGNPITIQVEMTMPAGWPSAWLLGANCQTTSTQTWDNFSPCNWSQDASDSAEIDINENFGDPPFTCTGQNVFMNGTSDKACSQTLTDEATHFHLYRLDWSTTQVCWFVDGTQSRCESTLVPTGLAFLIIENRVNSAKIPSTSNFPNTMVVHYVQVCSGACSVNDATGGNTLFLDDFSPVGSPASAVQMLVEMFSPERFAIFKRRYRRA
jgi:hypothetical protein